MSEKSGAERRGLGALVPWAALVALTLALTGVAFAQGDDVWGDDAWGDDEEFWGAEEEDDVWGEGEDFWDDDVWGDDDFIFDAADLDGPVSDAALRFLDEGLRYYESGDYVAASIFFWRVLNDEDPGMRGLRPRAQFELARTLVRMNLLQGAIYFFDRILDAGEVHPFFEDAAPWIVMIAQQLPGDFEMLRRVRAFESLFPDRIEPEYHDEMAFMLGQHFYNTGELERALQYLRFVSEFSPYYPQALFITGVTHVRLYQASPASGAFEALLQRAGEARARDRDLQRLGELARLSLARTLYSTGEFDRALDFYSAIERGSEFWLDALFESSWTDFRRGDYNRALGTLHSLNSPFFDDQFYPEAPILQAVIFLYNCRYSAVRRVLDEFELIYVPLREELESTVRELRGEQAYYNFLIEGERRTQGRFNPRLQQIVNATLEDRTVREALAYLETVEAELRRIGAADRAWANSELAEHLRERLGDTRRQTELRAGRLVQSRMTDILATLRSYERDARALLVETELGEADAISAELRQQVVRRDEEAPVVQRRPARHEIRWNFDGEYWKDEIGHYYYTLTSACR